MKAVRTYLKLLQRAPQVLRAINRSPELFAQLIEQHFAADAPGAGFAKSLGALPSVVPLSLRIDPALEAVPTLNVLIPTLALGAMSGGPNTAVQIAYRMAAAGVPVRFVSTDIPAQGDHDALFAHFAGLTGVGRRLPNVSVASQADRAMPLAIGADDVFFATAWWTAQMAKLALKLTRPKQFLYQIAEYEPALYPASSEYALALETYGLDYRGLICEGLLAEYLQARRIGRFAEPGFAARCAVFEPAVDETRFHPAAREPGPRRLLFYCRPTKARRNLSELGLHALRQAALAGVFAGEPWEMLFIGEDLPALELGGGLTIRAAPWLDYDAYAALFRRSDVLLSLMLSPHTSYPPLEFAACGGVAVHNVYETKTAARLAALSPNIVAVEPTVEGIVAGLREAVARPRAGRAVNLPGSWDAALADLIPQAVRMFRDCVASGRAD